MRKIPPEAKLYLPTLVTVLVGGEWLSGFEAAFRLRGDIHVITAWNPGSSRPSRIENDERNTRLASELKMFGSECFRAVGKDPDSDHFEESWAIAGLTDDQATEIGRRHGQVAVFRVSESKQTVLGCEGEWQVSRGSEQSIGMSAIVEWINDSQRRDHLQRLIDRYFGAPGWAPGFEGRQFEWFVSRSDPGRVTVEDLAAVGALSLPVSASNTRRLVEDQGGTLRDLLQRCQVEASRHVGSSDFSWLWKDESPFNALFAALGPPRFVGIGKVRRSKLMAAKFPDLVPIRDSRIEALLEWGDKEAWWQPIHEVLNSTKDTLAHLKNPPDIERLTLLRKLDVILWMEASDRGLG